jgi:hypothetical protein
MSADEFKEVFVRLYKLDPTRWEPEVFEILDRLFSDVDNYCASEVLRADIDGTDEETLRRQAQVAFDQLERIIG